MLTERMLFSPQACILLWEIAGETKGILAFIVEPHYFSGEMTAAEMIWYVEPEARAGCASLKLLWEAERRARLMGAKRMQFTAPHAAPHVEHLYRRFGGYQPVETIFQRIL